MSISLPSKSRGNILYNRGFKNIAISSAGRSTAGTVSITTPSGIIAGDLLITTLYSINTVITQTSGWNTVLYNGVWGTGGIGKERVLFKVASASEPKRYDHATCTAGVLVVLRFVDVLSATITSQPSGTTPVSFNRKITPNTYALVFYATPNSNRITLSQSGGTEILNVGNRSNLGGFSVGCSISVNSNLTVSRDKSSDILHTSIVGLV